MNLSIQDLCTYDHICVAFSGGKDSLACVLYLLERLPVDHWHKLELHHHDIDAGTGFMDWPCTPAYCKLVADHLKLPLYFSQREGGFASEMNRQNTPTGRVMFEDEGGLIRFAGGKGPPGTRGKFPQVSADLSVRWCSAYLKIDVMAAVLRNSARFQGKKTLVVTGERAEESSARARYKTFEPHRTHTDKRHVDHYRPIHHWTERAVWHIIQTHGIVPHPAYYLGWGRLSCLSCIFGSPNQWASIRAYFPAHFEAIAVAEEQTGASIQRKRTVRELADKGTPYAAAAVRPALVSLAREQKWPEGIFPIHVTQWALPDGAYGESVGPS